VAEDKDKTFTDSGPPLKPARGQAQPAGSVEAERSDQQSDLDFTAEEPSTETRVPAPRLGAPYDPRPHEDTARRNIAYLLIGLLWLIVVGMLGLVAFGTIAVADIKEFGAVIGPIVALVSAATGFYYGTKSVK
jgi:hypothetical protein